MRASFIIAAILVAVLMLGFAMNNLGTSVPVTLVTETSEYRLWLVVLASVLLGAAIMGVLGLIDGARTRLDNRRLRRGVHKLETELNFLRTQPATMPPESETRAFLPSELPDIDRPTPTGPVYEAEGANLAAPDDDESPGV